MLSTEQVARATQAITALMQAGMKDTFVPLAVAQIAHETAGFKSKVAMSCNNLSGIKYINKPYQKATSCTGSPEGNNYAKYANYTDWAKDYIRILNIGSRPIDATSVTDFANRLKANAYYTDSVANYTAGLNSWLRTFDTIIQDTKKKAL